MPPPTSCWRPSHDSFFDIRVGRLKPRILDEPAVTGLLSLYVSLWQLMSLPFLSAVFRKRTFLTIRCLFPTTLGISIPTIKANQPRSLARLWCGWLRCPPKSGHAHQSRVLATVFLDWAMKKCKFDNGRIVHMFSVDDHLWYVQKANHIQINRIRLVSIEISLLLILLRLSLLQLLLSLLLLLQ